MDKELQEQKKFLEDQLEWCRKRDTVLADLENKLHEMRALAEYAKDHKLTQSEVNELNFKVNELKKEVHLLDLQLNIHKN